MSKAEELLNIANKTNIAEDFVKAGNNFIIEDKYGFAAEAFEKAGRVYIVNNNKYTAANIYVKAADNYIKDKQYNIAQNLLNLAINNYLEEEKFIYAAKQYVKKADNYVKDKQYNIAQDLLNLAINIYLEEGKFASAARQLRNLAEIYCQNKQITLAIENYEKSCKWFCNENSKNTGYKILYKAAQLAIDIKEYIKAISLLIQVNEYYEINKITKSKCKQLFLQIAILKLYSVDEYEAYFLTQEKHKLTREYKLIGKLIKSLNKHDKEQFGQSIYVFNSIQSLEGWKLKLLTEINERI